MPLGIFGKKKSKASKSDDKLSGSNSDANLQPSSTEPRPNDLKEQSPHHETVNGGAGTKQPGSMATVTKQAEPTMPAQRPKLVFQCQQAQGSPVGIISGFTNVKELYQRVADCYTMDVSDILFCTLNTHKIDMSHLLGGQIGLEDFIFVHIKGQPKEIEVMKTEDALGLTITDNGAGYAFIKRIKEGSIMDKVPLVAIGDHLEKLNGQSLIGLRHFEVAKMLKEIPRGSTFLLRITEPVKSGFSNVGPPSGKKGSGNLGTGKQTLRLHKKGPASVEVADDVSDIAADKINGLLESFMGINDSELAQSIWEIGCKLDNPHNFAEAVDQSDLSEFGFTDEFIFDLWGAISDAKQGRLKKTQEFNEQF